MVAPNLRPYQKHTFSCDLNNVEFLHPHKPNIFVKDLQKKTKRFEGRNESKISNHIFTKYKNPQSTHQNQRYGRSQDPWFETKATLEISARKNILPQECHEHTKQELGIKKQSLQMISLELISSDSLSSQLKNLQSLIRSNTIFCEVLLLGEKFC